MQLQRLILENFGQYRGRTEIDLTPRTRYRKTRPVILIGGANGAGKTTVLDAIRLCLYGPLALGDRVSQEEYQHYLRASLHRGEGALITPQSAAVGLEFEYGFRGELHRFSVERSWDCNGNGVTTDLSVLRDGQPLDELEHAHADEFLRDLIPPGVSSLFFFDGEKIQEMAESADDDETLAESIRSLLGLDLVHRLHDDLSIYTSRLKDTDAANPIQKELKKLERELKQLRTERLKVVRAADQSEARVDHLRQEIAKTEGRLSKEGGGFASKRETLIAEQSQLAHTITEIQGRIRDFCAELFPFTFVPKLCEQVRDQLDAEKQHQAWQAHQDLLEGRIGAMKSGVEAALFADAKELKVSQKAQKALLARLSKLFDQLGDKPDSMPDVKIVHRLSEDDRTSLLSGIDRVLTDVPRQISGLEIELEQATRRLQEVKKALSKVPDDDVIEPYIKKLNGFNRELGSAQAERNRSDEALRSIDHKIADVERQKKRKVVQLDDLGKGFDRRNMARRVQTVLDEYSAAMTKAKIAELGNAVTDCFTLLWQKGDLLKRIEIDPASCNVMLFDRNDNPVPKDRLSAGEKQIYAISILWALAKVSGRVLPMVIDTPLARLDSRHRQHLVSRYFPNASHQVIILSTDTEIDEDYFCELDPSISHAYHLEFDDAEMRTTVEEGYFWSRKEAETLA